MALFAAAVHLAAAVLGWVASEATVQTALQPRRWASRDGVWISGRIVSPWLPRDAVPGQSGRSGETGGRWSGGDLVLAVDAVAGQPVSTKVRVLLQPGTNLSGASYGSRVAVKGRLRRPRQASNPGGFDARAYWLRQGVGYELLAQGPLLHLAGPSWRYRLGGAVLAVRRALQEGLRLSMPPGPRGVASALLLDDRGELSATARASLAETGLIHVLAVSGQHLAMVAAMAGWLTRQAGWLPGRRRWLAAAAVVSYVAVTGAPPSVLRAAVTYLLLEGAGALARPLSAVTALQWAGAAQWLWDPLVLLDPSFQLSYAATFGLVALYPGFRRLIPCGNPGRGSAAGLVVHETQFRSVSFIRRLGRWTGDALALTVAAQMTVLPVQVALFGRMPFTALLANVLAVPLSGVALAATFAAALGGVVANAVGSWGEEPAAVLARWLAAPASMAIAGLVRVAMAAERLPLSALPVAPAAAGWVAAASLWAVACLWDPRPAFARRLHPRPPVRPAPVITPVLCGFAMALTMTSMVDAPPAPGQLESWFLDVGQGDAILLRFPGGTTMLVDGGGRSQLPEPWRYWPASPPVLPDGVGEGITVPALRRLLRGRPLEVVAVTHGDRDHAGGVGVVLERVGARALWLGGVPGVPLDRALVELAERLQVPVYRPGAGNRWVPAPGCWVDVLHPPGAVAGPGERGRAAAGAPGGQGTPGPSAGRAGPSRTWVDARPDVPPKGLTSENNASLVLRVGCGAGRLLLTGDLEKEGEDALLAAQAPLQAHVLKVSHHGSRGGTQASFLAAVRPQLAIVSVGPNPYGLPHVETLARLRRAGVTVLRTDQQGAIRVTLGAKLEVQTMGSGP